MFRPPKCVLYSECSFIGGSGGVSESFSLLPSLFPESGGINFGLWFVFATPAMLLTLLLSWLYLSLLFCDDRWPAASLAPLTISLRQPSYTPIHYN